MYCPFFSFASPKEKKQKKRAQRKAPANNSGKLFSWTTPHEYCLVADYLSIHEQNRIVQKIAARRTVSLILSLNFYDLFRARVSIMKCRKEIIPCR